MTEKRLEITEDQLLWRHISRGNFDKGTIVATAFIPSSKDNRQLSVDRSSIVSEAKDSFDIFQSSGGKPVGTVGVMLSEFKNAHDTLKCYGVPLPSKDGKPANPAHSLVDYSSVTERKERNTIARFIADIANERGFAYSIVAECLTTSTFVEIQATDTDLNNSLSDV